MRLARRGFLASAMASVASPAISRLAQADAAQFAFKLHHSFSSVSSVHNQFIVPWARQVEAQSGGRIRIDIFPAMQLGGSPAQLFDQARDGISDIVWAAPRRTPGRFPKIELFELPFVPSRRALVSSRAIEDYARSNLAYEFREVHPICFSCSDRGVVHTHRPVRTVEDMNGLRLHAQTELTGEALRALGAVPVPMPSGQLPLAVTRHVIDGGIDPWDMVPALRLSDLLKAHTEFSESSLGTTTYLLAMNSAAYGRLPRDLKAVIDDNSGQLAAGIAGAMWDLKAAAVAAMVGQRGDTIITLLPEAVAHWRNATASVIEAWLKGMRVRGMDGGKLLASAHALLAKYADEPEPSPQPIKPQAAEAKADVNSAKVEVPPAPPALSGAKPPSVASPVGSPIASPVAAPAAKLTVAPPASSLAPQAPPPRAVAAPTLPLAKPAPAVVSPPKPLDIPL